MPGGVLAATGPPAMPVILESGRDRIIGRERELDELRAALDIEPPSAAAAVLLGPAGAGKTTLLQATAGHAANLGLRILLAQPSPAEARLSYSALGDLLAGLGEEPWAGLPIPQRRAFDVAFLRAESRGQRVEPRAIALGLAGLLRAASADSPPIVLAIDDTQWLDRPSAVALAYALRRLADAPIRLLACARTTRDQPLPQVIQAVSGWPTREIQVGPLSVGAIFELLRLRAGIRIPRPLLVRVHTASGGNPFFALEIARAIAAKRSRSRGSPAAAPFARRRDAPASGPPLSGCTGNPSRGGGAWRTRSERPSSPPLTMPWRPRGRSTRPRSRA